MRTHRRRLASAEVEFWGPRLVAYTFLRSGEIRSAEWGDVEWEARRLPIPGASDDERARAHRAGRRSGRGLAGRGPSPDGRRHAHPAVVPGQGPAPVLEHHQRGAAADGTGAGRDDDARLPDDRVHDPDRERVEPRLDRTASASNGTGTFLFSPAQRTSEVTYGTAASVAASDRSYFSYDAFPRAYWIA